MREAEEYRREDEKALAKLQACSSRASSNSQSARVRVPRVALGPRRARGVHLLDPEGAQGAGRRDRGRAPRRDRQGARARRRLAGQRRRRGPSPARLPPRAAELNTGTSQAKSRALASGLQLDVHVEERFARLLGERVTNRWCFVRRPAPPHSRRGSPSCATRASSLCSASTGGAPGRAAGRATKTFTAHPRSTRSYDRAHERRRSIAQPHAMRALRRLASPAPNLAQKYLCVFDIVCATEREK